MSKGILVFARNNEEVDYVKQAYHLAKRAKEYLDLPVTIVTDSKAWLIKSFPDYTKVFDKIIEIVQTDNDTTASVVRDNSTYKSVKRYNDGVYAEKKLQFKNEMRVLAYQITPYEQTLVLDTDIIICDNTYLACFNQSNELLLYKDAYDLSQQRDYSEFKNVSDTGIDFYWATCVYFVKSKANEIFFDLLQHIHENWSFYNRTYRLNRRVFRNDHAFSIAIHIMNGHTVGDFANPMPGKLFYTSDKDLLVDIKYDSLLFLCENENDRSNYMPIKTKGITVHVMNKFSLNRMLGESQ
jgi:hypothetical protein